VTTTIESSRERFFSLVAARPVIMGIVNVTPDSFSDGGRFFAPETALAQAQKLAADGADIVDVGAESTRPGHTPLTAEEEWSRLAPLLETLVAQCGVPVSIDTYKAQTARRALAAAGYAEAVTYSFTSRKTAELFGGGQPELALANPIATDLSDMRPSLLPGLVRAAQANADRGIADVALFEVSGTYEGDAADQQRRVAAAMMPAAHVSSSRAALAADHAARSSI
jgi:hypothetical protein